MRLNAFISTFFQIVRLSLFLSLFLTTPLYAKRVALVMGNDDYAAVGKLQKAGNDAIAMERELKKAGFSVQLHRDLNYKAMVKAIENFAKGIAGGDEVVVFYAGHGVQIKSGSYLLPIDIEANSESEVEKTAYELLALTDKINEAKPAFTLLMVDACRDNPLKSNGRSVGNSRGMSAIEPPKGQMVVYSASRGQQALDRLNAKDANPNSVFTREFITRMNKPGLKIEDLMREVQDAVEALAMTVNHEQRPAVYNESRGNFYFVKDSSNQPAVQQAGSLKEEKFWEDVKTAGNKEAFEAYLFSFPNGLYANLAKANLSRLLQSTDPSQKVDGSGDTQKLPLQGPKENESVKANSSLTAYQISSSGDGALRLGRTKIQAESCKKPEYPKTSKQKKEEGLVTIKLFVDSKGNLIKSEITQTSGYPKLDKASQASLNSCKFIPATVDGKNVDSWAEITYTWKLN